MTDQSRKQIPNHVHFIGISGSGMTPLAEISIALGIKVSGSDLQETLTTKRLKEKGALIWNEHRAENVENVELVVASTAIPKENPELYAALENPNCEVIHRSEYLCRLAHGCKLISVAGTHGKTTTAALIAHVLNSCGLEPKAAIGGEMINYGTYSLWGKGSYFVIEADESDGSFLNYPSFIAIVNNVDLDHMDFYQTLERTQQVFRKFMENIHPEGTAIVNWDDKPTFEISADYTGDRLTFGRRLGSEVRLLKRSFKDGLLSFDVMIDKDRVHGQSELMGDHNTQNILACLAVCHTLDLDFEKVIEGIRSFQGVKRRLSRICSINNGQVLVFDDYGHNPNKIRSAISALKEGFPNHELHVIFQPHRYSRLQTMYNEFAGAFTDSDHVFLLPVYAAGEIDPGTIRLDDFSRDISLQSNTLVTYFDHNPKPPEIFDSSNSIGRRIFLTIGAGDITHLSYDLRDFLNDQKVKVNNTVQTIGATKA